MNYKGFRNVSDTFVRVSKGFHQGFKRATSGFPKGYVGLPRGFLRLFRGATDSSWRELNEGLPRGFSVEERILRAS